MEHADISVVLQYAGCIFFSVALTYWYVYKRTRDTMLINVRRALCLPVEVDRLPCGKYMVFNYYNGAGMRLYFVEKQKTNFRDIDVIYLVRANPIGPVLHKFEVTAEKNIVPSLEQIESLN